MVEVNYRNVSINGISKTTLNNLDVFLKGAEKNWHWKLEFSNILKSKSYNTQNNNPVYLINQYNILFVRYVKLGLEFYF